MYAIIDIETTGGNNKSGRITEIAAFLHNGHKLVDKFTTLVNPEVPIPRFIRNLTGITNEMVADAPTFAEISEELDRFTANSVFVAHNAHFDYGFIREEYRRLGLEFKRKTLCTVRLSRSSFPDLKSYSLDKITAELNISLQGHHRAESDAWATVKLFEKIIQSQTQTGLFDAYIGLSDLSHVGSPYITSEALRQIPEEYGVGRFYNQGGDLIYVKRGAELLTTICSKLKPNASKGQEEFIHALHRIEGEVTQSKLLAHLIEAHEVLLHRPAFNYGRFSTKSRFGLYFKCDEAGPFAVVENSRREKLTPKMCFTSYAEGIHYLANRAREKGLFLEGYQEGGGDKKNPVYVRAKNSPLEAILPDASFLIIDEAGSVDTRTVILIRNGIPKGYAILNADEAYTKFDESDLTHKFEPFPVLEMIVRQFMSRETFEKIIPLP